MNPLERLVGATITKPLMRRRVLRELESLVDKKLIDFKGELSSLASPDNWIGPINTIVRLNNLSSSVLKGGAVDRILGEMRQSDLNLPKIIEAFEIVTSVTHEMNRGINGVNAEIAMNQTLTVSSILNSRMKAAIEAVETLEDWREKRRSFLFLP